MAVLTNLAPDPRRPGYRVVELDRGRFASLPEDGLAALGMVVGAVLTPQLLERLQALADVEAACRAVLRSQARRPHAMGDLRRRLIQKQHPPGAVDAALERTAAQGLVDDQRFAEHYVATRAARGRGPARLLGDLLRQGVARQTAETAIRTALESEAIDLERALRTVAERRLAALGGLEPHVKRRRLTAYLARRGYQGAEVRQLTEELIAADEVT